MDQIRPYNPYKGDYGLDKPGTHEPIRDPLDMISRIYAGISGAAPGVTQTGSPKPKIAPPDMLREISLVMNRLLKGNMPPREPDPGIIRQLGTKQEAGGAAIGRDTQSLAPNTLNMVPGPHLPHEVWDRLVTGDMIRPRGVPSVSSQPVMTLKSEQWIPDEWFRQGPGNIKRQVPEQRMLRYLERLQQQGLWP